MFKYGISYYTVENGERKPESGVDVRLLRPGADWQTGIPLIETGDTGYYECFIEDEKDCGFYEIWDNRNDTNGSFSGKYCTIGKHLFGIALFNCLCESICEVLPDIRFKVIPDPEQLLLLDCR